MRNSQYKVPMLPRVAKRSAILLLFMAIVGPARCSLLPIDLGSTVVPGNLTPTVTDTPLTIPSLAPSTSVTFNGTRPSNIYHVSSDGEDTNNGTKGSPWKTIQKAYAAASPGDRIVVTEGIYPEAISVDRSNIEFVAEGKVYMRGFFIKGNNNLIRGFIITNPSSDYGIRVYGNDNIVEGNDISDTGQDGIWFFGSGNMFRNNKIHDIVDRTKISTDPHVDCFQTWGPAENIIFERNICDHTSTYGSNQILMLENRDPPVRNIIFRNNIFIMHDPGYSPMNFNRKDGQPEISNMFVVNNTFAHVNGFGQSGIWLKNIDIAYAINNVFIDFGDPNHSYVNIEGGSGIKVCNNAIFKTDNIAPKGGPYPNDIWMENLGMVNPQQYDFHLTVSSPLVDTGANLTNIVKDDLENNNRPIGDAFDIGAFEYVSTMYKNYIETIQADQPSSEFPTGMPSSTTSTPVLCPIIGN